MRSISLSLSPNTDLLLALKELAANENAKGYVLGVVGNLSMALIKCPGRSEPNLLEGNLEIITLNGTISPDGIHLHLSVSDDLCKVWGGHLEIGSKVLKGVDILVGFIEKTHIEDSKVSKPTVLISPMIEIYTLQNCPWSKRSLRLLEGFDIPHRIHLIKTDEEFDSLNKLTSSRKFPQIFHHGKYIGGYDELVRIHSEGRLI